MTIAEDGSDAIALVGNDGSINLVAVETGAKSDVSTVVTGEGIKEGDKVVIFNTSMNGGQFGGRMGPGLMGGPMRELR